MAGHDDGSAPGPGIAHQLVDQVAALGVQPGVGLVEQPQLGVYGHQAGQGAASALAGAEAGHRNVAEAAAQAKPLEGGLDRPGKAAPGAYGEADVVDHRHVVVEGGGVANKPELAADRPTIDAEIVPEHDGGAVNHGDQPGAGAQQGGLPGTVRAGQENHLTGSDVEVDAREGREASEQADGGAKVDGEAHASDPRLPAAPAIPPRQAQAWPSLPSMDEAVDIPAPWPTPDPPHAPPPWPPPLSPEELDTPDVWPAPDAAAVPTPMAPPAGARDAVDKGPAEAPTVPDEPPAPAAAILPDAPPSAAAPSPADEPAPTTSPAPADDPYLAVAPAPASAPAHRSRRTGRAGRPGPARRLDLPAVLSATGRTLIALGLLVLGFVAFELLGTNVAESRNQDTLRGQLTVPPPPADLAVSQPAFQPAPPPPPVGSAVAQIRIPRIGVDKAVVEGVGLSDLRKGPGHYAGTPLPGQPGNAAIAGHRTTYGAPFFRLDEMKPGDPILVSTVQGAFRYEVRQVFVVKPGQVEVLDPTTGDQLTLTTCNPRFSAAQRLVVTADLKGPAAAASPPAPAVDPGRTPPGAEATPAPPVVSEVVGASGDPAERVPSALWGLAVLTLAVAGTVLGRLWRRWPAWLLTAVPLLAGLWIFYTHLAKAVPS